MTPDSLLRTSDFPHTFRPRNAKIIYSISICGVELTYRVAGRRRRYLALVICALCDAPSQFSSSK